MTADLKTMPRRDALEIAPGLALPLDAVTQKLAMLGRTGSGKTYGATKLAEQMHDAGAQIVALDPVGVWYGLRLAANGRDAGIAIPVFGGLHGDVPLEPSAGGLIADLVVDRGISAICDVSQFEHDTDKARFGRDFAARFFFRKKAAPSAVHVFLEECQEFVPQNPQKGEEQMLHAWLRMWKLGRNFGIGGSLISQRPQEVNKKAINLTECIFAFQLTGPHERKAIEGWIAEKGLDEDIGGLLPKLHVGEARVWSPSWLRISETVKISAKRTFNASSTPEVGASAKVRELAPIDLEKIRIDMAATIEKVKADDPKELRKKILDLERQLAAKPSAEPPVLPKVERIEVSILKDSHASSVEKAASQFATAAEKVSGVAGEILTELKRLQNSRRAPVAPILRRQQTTQPPRPLKAVIAQLPPGDLTGPEQRILDAIAWLESIGIDTPQQVAVAFLAGYTTGGGAWNNPRGRLRTNGHVEYAGEAIRLTESGRELAHYPEGALTAEELQRRVMERLPGPEQKILAVLIAAYPESLSNEELASRAGYASGGGAYNNPRGRLRSLGLIDYRAGRVVALPLLFLE